MSGRAKSTVSECALIISRTVASRPFCRRPVVGALPSSSIPKQRILASLHCSFCISEPSALIHVKSFTWSSSKYSPVRNRLRRRIGYRWRKVVSFCVNRIRELPFSSMCQFSQLISESWQYALLLPPCVRPNSSPARRSLATTRESPGNSLTDACVIG